MSSKNERRYTMDQILPMVRLRDTGLSNDQILAGLDFLDSIDGFPYDGTRSASIANNGKLNQSQHTYDINPYSHDTYIKDIDNHLKYKNTI